MKILAIGDFHGTFSSKFKKIIKKEKIDLVVSNGDFFPFTYRELWFKYCYKTDKELWDVIGRAKYKKLILEDLRRGEHAIRTLNNVPVQVITVVGNNDHTRVNDQYPKLAFGQHGKPDWKWASQDFFSKVIKKYSNIKRFDYSYFCFGEYVFIGAYGGSSPGKVTSSAYRKHKKLLDRLFERFRKENKDRKVIFVSHNVPYNTKLDKITAKDAPKIVKGKHYGSKLVRRTIEKWGPILHIGGHIHEGFGDTKIGKTFCLNIGSAHEGQGAIIDLDKGMKVRFIK